MNSTEQLAIDAVRVLSMDAVQKANSGHPGTPMALAPVAIDQAVIAPATPAAARARTEAAP